MTTVWDDPALTGALGDRIADDLRRLVRQYADGAERSQQKHLGPSEIGKPCTRCLARHVLGIPLTRDFDDPWCREIGTAIHNRLEEAAIHDNVLVNDPDIRWITEKRVHPHPDLLPAGGKADLYDAKTRTVIDHKTTSSQKIKQYRLNGPGPQYRVQAHLYGLGFHRTGQPVDHVAIAFWVRGGRLSDLYVWTEPYDVDIAMSALKRYAVIREQALALGAAILPLLPADPSCFDCGGKDVTADELDAATTQPNQGATP